jgi:hypothetical protein
MIKLIGRRASLLLLASLLMGSIFGVFQGSAALAQIGPEEPILYDGGGGGGGGGGGSWYCPITNVTVGGKTCTAVSCRPYSTTTPTQVCVFRSSDGQGGCPPLEQCQN